jgi:hypothetical protein
VQDTAPAGIAACRSGDVRARMTWFLFLEQCLNGLQFGLMLFLLAAGLTLVFGIMDLINLAHEIGRASCRERVYVQV